MLGLLGDAVTNGDPISYSPLAIVALVVGFVLRRMNASDAADQKRMNDYEAKLAAKDAIIEAKDKELIEQRSLKHAAINREARAEGTLDLIDRLIPLCTCHALDPVAPVLESHRQRRHRS